MRANSVSFSIGRQKRCNIHWFEDLEWNEAGFKNSSLPGPGQYFESQND